MPEPEENKSPGNEKSAGHKSKTSKRMPVSILVAIIGVIGLALVAFLNPIAEKIINPPTATSSPTSTFTFTPTFTPTATATFTPSPTPTFTPSPSPTPLEVTISVFSAQFPFKSTGVTVHVGDRVEITVVGDNPGWDCGRHGNIGPLGYDEKYLDLVFNSAPACALIGAIAVVQPDENFPYYFLVGGGKEVEPQQTGELYLGCNDSRDRFGDNPTDSWLDVRIIVRH